MTNTYDPGDSVNCSINFQNNTPIDADPTTVKGMFRNAVGTWTTYVYGVGAELIKDSTGDYHFIVYIPNSASASGLWIYRFEGLDASDNPLAAAEGKFNVRLSYKYSE